jgi:uroporphyrin-III C-methyltransferase
MGKVFLVGAGPGDPELLTVKAVRLLGQADIVLHDALVPQAILDVIRPGATVIDIGKRRGHKLLTQQEINSLLVSFASNNEMVVRLKGGDPSIFGRAGEEIEALTEAGIEFEIVPGITAACASAAAAGVSLTDRRFASSLVFTTAHRRTGAAATEWNRLVTSESTVVIYMPGQEYREVSELLRDAGIEGDTPCTVVSSAGTPAQSVLRTHLASLARTTALPAPSLLIVGRCASALTQLQRRDLFESVLDRSTNLRDLDKSR